MRAAKPDMRVAVIEFPGSNCQEETRRALEAAGVGADIVRWNEDPARLAAYGGFVLPAGFSYQDRVRAGALAAKDTVMDVVSEAAGEGRPVLGICNGCQILLEAGLVPGLHPGRVEMALAPNVREGGRAFYCRWVFVRHTAAPGRCLLAEDYGEGEVWPVPIAHAEGRFTTETAGLVDELVRNDQIVFRYSDAGGDVRSTPDVNPNGSVEDIAGLCNPGGNVLALMPHPERAAWLRQVPEADLSPWAERRARAAGDAPAMDEEGPGRRLFRAFLGGMG